MDDSEKIAYHSSNFTAYFKKRYTKQKQHPSWEQQQIISYLAPKNANIPNWQFYVRFNKTLQKQGSDKV